MSETPRARLMRFPYPWPPRELSGPVGHGPSTGPSGWRARRVPSWLRGLDAGPAAEGRSHLLRIASWDRSLVSVAAFLGSASVSGSLTSDPRTPEPVPGRPPTSAHRAGIPVEPAPHRSGDRLALPVRSPGGTSTSKFPPSSGGHPDHGVLTPPRPETRCQSHVDGRGQPSIGRSPRRREVAARDSVRGRRYPTRVPDPGSAGYRSGYAFA